MDEKNFKNRRLVEKTKEELTLETFQNVLKMTKGTVEDQNMAFECIKNLDLSENMIRLLIKRTTYRLRGQLISLLNCSHWSFQDLTMKEIYNTLKESSTSVEKEIFNHYAKEHFDDLLSDYPFIKLNTEVQW